MSEPLTEVVRSTGGTILALSNSLRSEWTKFRSLRSAVYLAGATIGAAMVLAAAYSFVAASEFHTRSGGASPFDPDNPTGTALFSVFLAQVAVMALGALTITGEYATRTIQLGLTVQPRRGQFFAAKAVVTFAVSLMTGAVAGIAAFTVGQLILASQGAPYATLGEPRVVRAVLGVGLYLALVGVLSLAVGAITRATSGALVIMIVGVIMVPNLAALLPSPWGETVQRYWPTMAGLQIMNTEHDPSMLEPWLGLGLLASFVVLMAVVAAIVLRYRDA